MKKNSKRTFTKKQRNEWGLQDDSVSKKCPLCQKNVWFEDLPRALVYNVIPQQYKCPYCLKMVDDSIEYSSEDLKTNNGKLEKIKELFKEMKENKSFRDLFLICLFIIAVGSLLGIDTICYILGY